MEMIQDYSISKCTRKCAISGQPLAAGEIYYSVILPAADDVVRVDISQSQWKGPEAGAICWWKCQMPAAGPRKLKPAPNGVLLDTLSGLLDCPTKQALAYFLALLLVRRRVLKEERQLDGTNELDNDSWHLVCTADGRQWTVPVVEPRAEQIQALEDEISGLLFTEE
ncbi:MAG: hypothetical protein KDB22_10835 [Planctomycetales bacterium]|nr:hypothetical protein [Planctomycetales bacterium]